MVRKISERFEISDLLWKSLDGRFCAKMSRLLTVLRWLV